MLSLYTCKQVLMNCSHNRKKTCWRHCTPSCRRSSASTRMKNFTIMKIQQQGKPCRLDLFLITLNPQCTTFLCRPKSALHIIVEVKFVWQISRPPWEWCKFGQVFNDQLGHLYKLGDWKTVESWPMLKFFGQNPILLKQTANILCGKIWVALNMHRKLNMDKRCWVLGGRASN